MNVYINKKEKEMQIFFRKTPFLGTLKQMVDWITEILPPLIRGASAPAPWASSAPGAWPQQHPQQNPYQGWQLQV